MPNLSDFIPGFQPGQPVVTNNSAGGQTVINPDNGGGGVPTYPGTNIPLTEPNPNPQYNPYTGELITGSMPSAEQLRTDYIIKQQMGDPSYNPDFDPNVPGSSITPRQQPSQTAYDIDTVKQLKDQGKISETQYLASLQAFSQGAKGVDPFGFSSMDGTFQGRKQNPLKHPQPIAVQTPAPQTAQTRAQQLLANAKARGQQRVGTQTGTQGGTQGGEQGGVPGDAQDTATPQADGKEGEDQQAGVPGTSVQTPEGTKPDPAMAGFLATIANLPPEAQFLAPYLQSYAQSVQQALTENATQTAGMYENIQKTYGGIETMLQDMQQGYKESSQAIQGLLEDAKVQNDDFIAKQKRAEEERLTWEKARQERELGKQKAQAHDSMVAQIALAGGFGQDAGMRAVMESDNEFDSKMRDMEQAFTFARTDLVAKYTGMYVENKNNYVNSTIQNMKDLRSSLERIGLQQIGNVQARQQAEQNLLQKAWETQTSLRQDLAKQNLSVAKDIQTMIDKKRDDKRAQQKDLWALMQNHLAIFGNSAPDLRKNLVRQMQEEGINVSEDMFASPTIAQVNELFRQNLETQKLNSKGQGRPMVSTQATKVSDYDQSVRSLTNLLSDFVDANGNPIYGKTGPITGLRSMNPFDTEAQTLKAKIKKVKQIVGKAMEGGVLRKEDEAKYNDILAKMQDSPQVAANKINELIGDMQANKEIYLNDMEAAGYDVSGFQPNGSDPVNQPAINSLPDDQAESIMEQILNATDLGAALPRVEGVTDENLQSSVINGREVTGQPFLLAALDRANAEMVVATGKGIDVASTYRTAKQQEKAWNDFQSGKIARAAPPGKSFHQKGLAMDIKNWKEAAPYLKKYGIVNGLENDMGHFSIGEMNPDLIAYLSTNAHSYS